MVSSGTSASNAAAPAARRTCALLLVRVIQPRQSAVVPADRRIVGRPLQPQHVVVGLLLSTVGGGGGDDHASRCAQERRHRRCLHQQHRSLASHARPRAFLGGAGAALHVASGDERTSARPRRNNRARPHSYSKNVIITMPLQLVLCPTETKAPEWCARVVHDTSLAPSNQYSETLHDSLPRFLKCPNSLLVKEYAWVVCQCCLVDTRGSAVLPLANRMPPQPRNLSTDSRILALTVI